MKRFLPLILCLCLLFLSACGKKEQTGNGDPLTDITDEVTGGDGQSEQAESADLSSMNLSFSDRDGNTTVAAGATEITLKKNGAEVSGSGAAWQDGRLKITAEGTYTVSGDLDGYIEVDADGGKLQLVLCGVKINNQSGPALYIKAADKVFLTLAEGTENSLSDGESYTFTEDDGADGAVFSRADLTINGSGGLNVTGNRKHAVVSKDDLVITGGNINVTSAGVGLEGKDCVKITTADIKIDAGSDGIRSTNTEDPTRGFVYVASGKIDITSGNDGIQGETAVKIDGGSISISSGGGSANSSQSSSGDWNEDWMRPSGSTSASENTTESAKGIKASCEVVITGGTLDLDTADDTVHSNDNITISGGTINASSGDDGMHADTALNISGGTINILKSYEGLEATDITISGGKISIVASDDGLNAAGGNDGSAMGGRPGMGQFSEGTGSLVISGGRIDIDASGDGVDSNGTLTVTGGETYVSGPENSGNGALDYGSSATVTGGTFVATGASGMATGFTNAENQGAMIVHISSTVPGGETIKLKNAAGKTIVEFTPEKSFSSIVLSHKDIAQDETYTFYIGDTDVGDIEMTSLLYGSSGGMGGGRPGGRW